MRVAIIYGFAPADTSHLTRLAEDVDLVVYHSRWRPAYAPGPGRLAEYVSEHRFEPVVRSKRGHLWFWYRGLEDAVRRDRPDVIHVVCEPWGMLALQASRAALAVGARLVLHGCDTIWHHGSPIEQRARRAVLSRTLPVTRAWVAENEKALDVALASGLPASALRRRIHTNPRDAGRFSLPDAETRARARARLGVNGELVITMIGRLVPEKGVASLLEAAAELRAAGVHMKILVAGDGPLRPAVETTDVENVVSLGPVRHPEGVVDLLHASDVLACPSLTTPSWEDQGPRAVLEAMMCGVTPVVTPTGALPPMVGDLGVVAASTDPLDIAKAIRDAGDVGADLEHRSALSAWATDQYSADAVSRALAELWREVAALTVDHLDDRSTPMNSTSTSRVLSDDTIESIPGWLPPLDRSLFDLILARQDEAGDLAEMGVYKGKTAVVIGAHQRPAETFTIVDLFEVPADNAHNSAENDREYAGLTRSDFEANYRRVHGVLPVVVEGPSESIADTASHGTHRFVHIDASHLYEHVRKDLEVAHLLLREDGVVVMDDIRSAHTPGVAAAAWEAVAHGLRPFAITSQKLYATWGDPSPWHAVVKEWAVGARHEEQIISGRPVIRLWSEPPAIGRWVPPALVPTARRTSAKVKRLVGRS